MKIPKHLVAKAVKYVNRKNWWHVPPAAKDAYEKRGKFFASSFSEAEFYGRPLDYPHRVVIAKPLVGDEKSIASTLKIPAQREEMNLEEIAAHDAMWRKAALKKGYDSLVLMTAKAFVQFKASGKLPRSIELNVLDISSTRSEPEAS